MKEKHCLEIFDINTEMKLFSIFSSNWVENYLYANEAIVIM